MDLEVKDLSQSDYDLICRLVYDKSGINLGEGKTQLVRTRPGKRCRSPSTRSFK